MARSQYRNPLLPKGFEKTHTRFDEERQAIFLEEYAKTGRVMHSAAVAGVCDQAVRDAAKKNENFAAAYDAAREVFKEMLEVEAYARGVQGWEEPVVQKGEVVFYPCPECKRREALKPTCQKCDGTGNGDMVMTKRRSDRVFELLLKRHIPEYRDKFEMDVTASGGVLAIPATGATEKDWEDRWGGEVQEAEWERVEPEAEQPLAELPEVQEPAQQEQEQEPDKPKRRVRVQR